MTVKIKDKDKNILKQVKDIQKMVNVVNETLKTTAEVKQANRLNEDKAERERKNWVGILEKQNEILEYLVDEVATLLIKQGDDTTIRPCVCDGRSVIFHGFADEGNTAIIEYSDGYINKVRGSNIRFLDSKYHLLNGVAHINDVQCLEEYYGNEECFNDEYKKLKHEYPKVFTKEV